MDDAEELRYARAGQQFFVYLDQSEQVVIVDIAHPQGDLPRHVAALGRLSKSPRYRPAALVRFTRNRSRRRW